VAVLAERTARFKAAQRDFQGLLLDVVTDDAFGHRRDEEVP
jgi:hypothetical protein